MHGIIYIAIPIALVIGVMVCIKQKSFSLEQKWIIACIVLTIYCIVLFALSFNAIVSNELLHAQSSPAESLWFELKALVNPWMKRTFTILVIPVACVIRARVSEENKDFSTTKKRLSVYGALVIYFFIWLVVMGILSMASTFPPF